MAAVEQISGGYRVVARDRVEEALLDHGRASGGELVLGGAIHQVGGDGLLLPAGISYGAAHGVRLAFEAAAISHQQARSRRSGFKLL